LTKGEKGGKKEKSKKEEKRKKEKEEKNLFKTGRKKVIIRDRARSARKICK